MKIKQASDKQHIINVFLSIIVGFGIYGLFKLANLAIESISLLIIILLLLIYFELLERRNK